MNDESKVQDSSYFTHNQMAHGLVKSGKSVQVVVGMSVPQVREAFEHLVYEEEKVIKYYNKRLKEKELYLLEMFYCQKPVLLTTLVFKLL